MWLDISFLYVLPVLAFAGLLLALNLRDLERKGSEKMESLPYKKRNCVFNRSEQAFYLELLRQLPAGYHVFPKMRVIDFIEPQSSWRWRNKIWAKHVDFLICNAGFQPVLGIEVNGPSHMHSTRMIRDVFLANVFKAARLPLEFVCVGSEFSSHIEALLRNMR